MAATDRLTDDDLDRLREAVERIEDDQHETDTIRLSSISALITEAKRLLSTATHREAMDNAIVQGVWWDPDKGEFVPAVEPEEEPWVPVEGEFVTILPGIYYPHGGAGTVVSVDAKGTYPYLVQCPRGDGTGRNQKLPLRRDEVAPYVLERLPPPSSPPAF